MSASHVFNSTPDLAHDPQPVAAPDPGDIFLLIATRFTHLFLRHRSQVQIVEHHAGDLGNIPGGHGTQPRDTLRRRA